MKLLILRLSGVWNNIPRYNYTHHLLAIKETTLFVYSINDSTIQLAIVLATCLVGNLLATWQLVGNLLATCQLCHCVGKRKRSTPAGGPNNVYCLKARSENKNPEMRLWKRRTRRRMPKNKLIKRRMWKWLNYWKSEIEENEWPRRRIYGKDEYIERANKGKRDWKRRIRKRRNDIPGNVGRNRGGANVV